MNRLIVSGASGLLGSNLVETLKGRFAVLGSYGNNPVRFDGAETVRLDILSATDVEKVICDFSPEAVIHCAAETRVDFCEDHPEEAFRINEEGARVVASAAARCGTKLVYISTDSVFDGARAAREQDQPHPLNIYAKSKLAGEKAVAALCDNSLIVRTNIFGWNVQPRLTLAEWVIQSLSEGGRIPGFTDIIFSPLLVNDLARLVGDMLNGELKGIYHVGARDRCSKFDFARSLARIFGMSEEAVFPSRSDEISFKAKRPRDTSLDVTRVTEALGAPMPAIAEGLERFKKLRDEGFVERLRSGRMPEGG